MSYVYVNSEPGLWTVGFYDPSGKWQPESDFNSTEEAARWCATLNGGADLNQAERGEIKEFAEHGKTLKKLHQLERELAEARAALSGRTVSCAGCERLAGELAEAKRKQKVAEDIQHAEKDILLSEIGKNYALRKAVGEAVRLLEDSSSDPDAMPFEAIDHSIILLRPHVPAEWPRMMCPNGDGKGGCNLGPAKCGNALPHQRHEACGWTQTAPDGTTCPKCGEVKP